MHRAHPAHNTYRIVWDLWVQWVEAARAAKCAQVHSETMTYHDCVGGPSSRPRLPNPAAALLVLLIGATLRGLSF